MSAPRVRPGTSADAGVVGELFFRLWPDDTLAAHSAEAALVLAGAAPGTLPLTVLVAEVEGEVVGFAQVGLRSHADGCDTAHPVGFLEGWYVRPAHQRRGIGRALVRAAEEWARGHGCREMASDTWLESEESQAAHAALGFEIVDRVVNFRKSL
jgi:aminoglycoside 6'-N-acetyltransferase I